MRKSTIWLIIIFMSIALIGLCSFQVYWINNAIALNEERFERTIQATLNDVVNKLERLEAVEMTTNALYESSSATDWIGSVKVDRSDSSSVIKINRDSSLLQSSGVFITSGSPSITLALRDTTHHFFRDSALRGIEGRLSQRSEMINVVFKQLVSDERDIKDRITHDLLDSLLHTGLKEKGVNISYQYAVLDGEVDTVILTNASGDIKNVTESSFKAGLFPNDLFGNVNYLMVNFPDQGQYLFGQIWATLAASVLFVLIIVGSFSYAIFIIFRQKKLSDIKNDFINNMTHEFKTPIATVSLACEALQEDEVRNNESTLMRYVGMIRDENLRLGDQVEKVLQTAMLERDSFKLKLENTNLVELIQSVLDNVEEQVTAANGQLNVEFKSKENNLLGDKHHLTNLFYNLVDNAIKYSTNKVNILITTFNDRESIYVEVRDHGIGMNKEELSRIFEKFYRVPTGNRHDVKGFGLGLNYVKTIVNLHDGNVFAKSEPAKGSTFTIKLPLKNA